MVRKLKGKIIVWGNAGKFVARKKERGKSGQFYIFKEAICLNNQS